MPTVVTRPPRRLRPGVLVPAALGLGFAGLAACAAAGQGGALFFPLLSLWAGCALLALTWAALCRAGVRLELYHGLVTTAVYLVLAICTCLQVEGRDFLYTWDYSNYLLLQYAAEEAFAAGPLSGLGRLVSTFAEEYTSFLCLFTEFPFCLTGRTGDDYVLSQLVSVLPALLLALAGLVRKVGQLLAVQNEKGFFLLGLSLAACYPFVRMSAALGQPDWLGLVFALLILVLTLDYRFDYPDAPRCIGLFLATAALVLSRRWYLYFVVSYYMVYAVTVLAGVAQLAARGQRGAPGVRLRGLITFGAGSLAAMLILFQPVVLRVLGYGYAEHYAAYNGGGLALELYNQAFRLGPFYLPLAAVGAVWAVRQRRGALVAQTVGVLALSMVLFTRVQNMGSHQTLLLLPGYLTLILLGAAALAESLSRRRLLKLGYWLAALAFSLSARLSPLTILPLPDFLFDWITAPALQEFIRLDTMIYDRSDIGQVRALAEWIDLHCAEGEHAYMIPHSMTYNPDTFKNAFLPSRPLADKLSFGFGILGTQPFPTDFFDAKYVVTAEPFPWCYEVSSMAAKLNDCFFAISGSRFVAEERFDMGNGTVFTVYRRIVPASRAEAEAYLAAFAEEDARFPELFSGVVEPWLAARGL